MRVLMGIITKADQSLALVGHLLGHVDTLRVSIREDAARIQRESQELATLLQERVETGKLAVEHLPRAMHITRVLLGVVIRYRVLAMASEQRREQLHHDLAKTIKQLCIESGGALLKLGQFLSMRGDLLPAEYIEQLSSLRNQVPAKPFEQIREQIETELGGSLESLFAHLDPVPVATASLAQVHQGRTHAGQLVAIKVQIPEASQQVLADITLLRLVASHANDVSKALGRQGSMASSVDFEALVAQLAISLSTELDYKAEAEQLCAMAKVVSDSDRIRVPQLYSELSSRCVLTMEWRPGKTIDVALKQGNSHQRRDILEALVESFCQQIFVHGHFHADPHAGNILVQDDGRLVLLDFGCTQKLTEEQRRGYQKLMLAVFTGNRRALQDSLMELGFTCDEGTEHKSALEDLVVAMTEMLARPGAVAEWSLDPHAATQALWAAASAVPGLVTPPHFTMLGRVLGTLGGLLVEYPEAMVSLPAMVGASVGASVGARVGASVGAT